MSTRSPYAVVIDATRLALTERAAAYRNLVVVVVLIVVVAVALAIGAGRWWPLSILSALPAAVLTFAWRDAALLRRWRAAILQAWSANALRLDVLAMTLRQVPGLPPETLAGMLTALPLALEGVVPMASRGLAAVARDAVDAAADRWLLGRAGTAWGAAAVLVAAAAAGSAVVFGVLLAPIAAFGVWRVVVRR